MGNTRPSKKRAPVKADGTASAAENVQEAPAPVAGGKAPFQSDKPAPAESEAWTPPANSTPPRKGTVTKKAAAKPAAKSADTPETVKAAVPKKATVTEVDGSPVKIVEVAGEGKRFVIELEQIEDSKTYARFEIPGSAKGCLGRLYLPKGTTWVRVAFGAGDE